MSDSLIVDKTLSDPEIWESLFPQIVSLLNPDEPVLSNMSNIIAAINEAFPKISWIGFYLLKGEKLFLGPFQGKTACVTIELGKGVCGTAASSKKSVIVDDVNKFPGHIACDSNSKSEIVIPLLKGNNIFGVLDLDSHEFSSFNSTDQLYLEKTL